MTPPQNDPLAALVEMRRQAQYECKLTKLVDQEIDHVRALIEATTAYVEFSKDVVVSPAAPELKPIRDAIRKALAGLGVKP